MVQTSVGARVSCRDGWAGTLKRLVVDSDRGKITHLVIETALLLPHYAIVPVEHVIASGYEAIFLDLISTHLETYCARG